MAATLSASSSGLSQYEIERLKRIEDNKRRLVELGIAKQAQLLLSLQAVPKRPASSASQSSFRSSSRTQSQSSIVRRSQRLLGNGPDLKTDECQRLVDDEVGLFDLMDRTGHRRMADNPSEEQLKVAQEVRCASQGRGSIYDSAVGITCHFCRQKKLCGEPDCTRCHTRDASLDCIGKSDCSKCHSATGKFCRACLLVRYGWTLEEVRKQMEEKIWLCPHCYEEEHPECGLICNSSICMTRRGLRPTGIAIFEAQAQGFKSVAHYLQAQIQKRGLPCSQSEVSNASACTVDQLEGQRKRKRPDVTVDVPTISNSTVSNSIDSNKSNNSASASVDCRPATRRARPGLPPTGSNACQASGRVAKKLNDVACDSMTFTSSQPDISSSTACNRPRRACVKH